MTTLSFQLRITLKSSLHIGTGVGFAGLIDEKTVAGRAAYMSGGTLTITEEPVPYLPASSIKGKLRHHFTEIAHSLGMKNVDQVCSLCNPPERCPYDPPCDGCLLFGALNYEGVLRLTDAHLSSPYIELADVDKGKVQPHFLLGNRNFVAMSRIRRAARLQQLATIQDVSPNVGFESIGTALLGSASAGNKGYLTVTNDAGAAISVHRSVAILVAAVRNCTHLGGHAARGMGRVSVKMDSLMLDGQSVDPNALLRELQSSIP